MKLIALTTLLLPGYLYAQSSMPAVSKYGPGDEVVQSQTNSYIDSTIINLNVRDSSLKYVINELARQAKLRAVYDNSEVFSSRTVTINLRNVKLFEAYEAVLKGTGLVATLASDRETVVIGVRSAGTDKQGNGTKQKKTNVEAGNIKGRVVDSATGSGIPGVTVQVVGTASSVTTDSDGDFIIPNVSVGKQQIVFKLLGYKNLTRTADVKTDVVTIANVRMVQSASVLAGVVTTAAGTQQRRSVGNDITVLNVDSIMQTGPVSSVTDILETRVPGLTVIRSSGVPGAPSRIRLRGVGGGLVSGAANTSNDPIVIVDGIRVYAQQSTNRDQNLAPGRTGGATAEYSVPSALDQIDPNSIETIEVFKGPSATSQWGADAGNGVIVITTKKGRPGQTRYSMALASGFERMPGTYASPGYYRFAHGVGNLESKACSVFRYDGDCTITDSIIQFQALNNRALSPFGTGSKYDGSFTVAGGSDAVVYSLTATTHDNVGYLKMPTFYRNLYEGLYGEDAPVWMRRPTGYKGWGISTSMMARPSQDLAITISTSLSTSDAARNSGETMLNKLSSMYLDTAQLKLSPFRVTDEGGIGQFMERGQSRRVVSNLGVQSEWTRWASLLIRGTVGINTDNREDNTLVPFGRSLTNRSDTLGSFSVGRGQAVTRSANLNGVLWSGRLVSNAIGLQITQTSTRDFGARTDTLYPGVEDPTQLYGARQQSFASTTAGWFVEPKLNVNSRFFLIPGFRFDGGSASSGGRTGSGLFAFFPKLNFSWIAIDREGSEALGGILSLLRPRLGFGVAGVQPEPSWSLRMMSGNGDDPKFSQNQNIDGLVLQTIGNPDLRPERSREIEGGFEASLWEGRVNLNVSAYTKLRIDAIQQINLAPSVSTKLRSYYTNIGRVRNNGIELSVDTRLIETQLLSVSVDGTMTRNSNIVLALAGGEPYIQLGRNQGRLQVGYPISGRWGRPIVGYNTDPLYGRITVDDYSLADSAIYLGAGFPKWQLPFGTTLSFLGGTASLSTRFEYKQGLTQFNSGNQALLERLYADPNATLAQQAVALAAMFHDQDNNIYGSPVGLVQTINSLRFSSVSINYNIPRSLSARLRIPSATVSFQGSNIGLWTNYRGKDPDVNSVRIGEDVRDDGEAPRPRAWTVRILLRN